MAQIDDDLFVISGIVGTSGYPTAITIMERICAYIKDVQNSSHNAGSLPLLLREFKKNYPSLDIASQLAITSFVLWAQQQQASA